ncbi:MAG: hypothetical protein WAT71_17900 [Ignavibacteria bacterium]
MNTKLTLFSILVLSLIFINIQNTYSQTSADLNGSRFRGKAEEQTPPDVDRMPIMLVELIIFADGKISGEVLNKYSVSECSYSAEIDERRMIAVKVINFISECQGVYENENVTLKFKGSIYGDLWMSGDIVITTADYREIKFLITGEAE